MREQLQEEVAELERQNRSLWKKNIKLKSQHKQQQLEDTKGSNEVSTGKKRKVKIQGREPRSKIQKYGSEHMQKWDELRQPHKNKRPRSKKKKETVRSSKGQTTRSQATKSHLAKRDGDASSSSSLDEEDNVSSDASSVAEGSSSSNQEEPMLTASSASSDNESNI